MSKLLILLTILDQINQKVFKLVGRWQHQMLHEMNLLMKYKCLLIKLELKIQ